MGCSLPGTGRDQFTQFLRHLVEPGPPGLDCFKVPLGALAYVTAVGRWIGSQGQKRIDFVQREAQLLALLQGTDTINRGFRVSARALPGFRRLVDVTLTLIEPDSLDADVSGARGGADRVSPGCHGGDYTSRTCVRFKPSRTLGQCATR